MSKESRRLGREEIKELRKQRKKAAKALREKQETQGLVVPVKAAMPIYLCFSTVDLQFIFYYNIDRFVKSKNLQDSPIQYFDTKLK